MKTLDQLDELKLDAVAKTQVAALIQALLDQVRKEAEKFKTDIQARDLKIQALIRELAHLRRLRYSVKTEALSSLQKDLFDETYSEIVAGLVLVDEREGGGASCGSRTRNRLRWRRSWCWTWGVYLVTRPLPSWRNISMRCLNRKAL